jgi:amino acid transporter
VKRLLLGPALPTSALEHERLGKPTALAVFASDNLSSVAYATEEILKVAVPVVGLASFGLLMPLTGAMLVVLAILLFSYRQTIKAYPRASGAYIVTKDNFGVFPAQFAGAALLTDYILTVAVSIAAGVAAVTSAFPGLYPWRVWLSVSLVWLIAVGNLRGLRESGRMFAIPTYFFIAMMGLLLGAGLVKVLTGSLDPLPIPDDVARTTGAIGLFLVLHAFASGGAAVTGVEAISDGVPAFRPPEWRNARVTLLWMGGLLAAMFLGLSFLAYRLHATPTDTRTVISEIGRAVFGAGAVGYALFLGLQVATTAILVMAANTAFADFPRLANFHAGDEFMPRQLTKRGHRLVYSNGVVGLSVAASLLLVLFSAEVHRLIPLYAIGVFASFTMSQTGMAKRHLRLRAPGWRHGFALNGIGALTTALVTVVVGITKFAHGAWAVMVLVPVLVLIFTRMNRHYLAERSALEATPWSDGGSAGPRVAALVVVDALGPEEIHAFRYARTIAAGEVVGVHLERDAVATASLRTSWADAGLKQIPLRVLRGDGDPGERLAGFVGGMPEDRPVAVLLPVPHDVGPLERLSDTRTGARLARALAPYEHVSVTLVRDHPDDVHRAAARPRAGSTVALTHRSLHTAIVLIDGVDRAVVRAVRYAQSLGATEVRALHAAADPPRADRVIERWIDLGLPIPLDVIECFDRDVPRAIERHVIALSDPLTEITVVMPRRDYPSLRQRALHDRTSRRIARAVGRYPHVDVTVVPFAVVAPVDVRSSVSDRDAESQPAGSATQR